MKLKACALIFVCCLMMGTESDCEQKQEDSISVETKAKESFKVDGWDGNFYEFEHQGCQYIYYVGYGDNTAMTHKGNCNSPVHTHE